MFYVPRALGIAAALLALAACSKKPATDAATLENKFQTMMTGATLVGHSTSFRKEGMSDEERYTIDKVTKLAGNTWMFQARMNLRGHEVPVPVPVTIMWAGDTPVLELTDASIPGMGSFSVRLVFYQDQYAGTWSGHGFGGQMFGKIVHEQSERK